MHQFNSYPPTPTVLDDTVNANQRASPQLHMLEFVMLAGVCLCNLDYYLCYRHTTPGHNSKLTLGLIFGI